MASGVNFNPSSFQVQPGRVGGTPQQQLTEQPVANPTDGFQASMLTEQPNAAPTGSGQSVTLTVTPEQLSSAAFQQTLVSLQNSGIHVNIALQNAQQPTNSGRTASSSTSDEIRQLRQELHHDLGIIAERVKPQAPPPKPATYGGD